MNTPFTSRWVLSHLHPWILTSLDIQVQGHLQFHWLTNVPKVQDEDAMCLDLGEKNRCLRPGGRLPNDGSMGLVQLPTFTNTNQLNAGTENVASPMDPMGLWDLGTHLWSEKSHDCHCMVIFRRDFLPCYDLSYNQVMMKEASRLSICCFRDWRDGWCSNFELILLMVRKSRVSPVEDGSLSHYLPGKFTSQVVFLRNFWAISLTSFIHCFPTWDIKTNPMKTPKLMKLDFVVAVWTRWSCYPVFFRKTICCIFAVNVMNRTISNKRFKTCNQFCTSF